MHTHHSAGLSRDMNLFYETLLNSVKQAVIATDTEGIITYMNHAAELLYGWQSNDALGRSILAVTVPQTSQAQAQEILTQLRQGRDWLGEFLVQHKDGTIFLAEVQDTPMFDPQGKFIGVIGVSSDITERKRFEAEIEQHRHHLQQLVEKKTMALDGALAAAETVNRFVKTITDHVPAMIGYWTDELRCTFSNQGYIDWFGKTAEQMRGIHYREMLGDELFRFSEPYMRAALRGERQQFERTSIKADDSASHTSWIHYVPDYNGERVCGFFALASDITERKRMELEALRASRQLQALSNRLIEVQEEERRRISRELHAEIGQALTAVTLQLKTARQSQRTDAERIDQCIMITEDTLERVRDMSLNLRPPHLDDLGIEAALRWLLQRQAQAAGWQAEIVIDPLPGRVATEIETECFRIAQEALTNAARHADAKHVRVALRIAGKNLELTVRDDGIGFEPEQKHPRPVGRSGLGLISMKERAQIIGGKLSIKRRDEGGTEIVATVPLRCGD